MSLVTHSAFRFDTNSNNDIDFTNKYRGWFSILGCKSHIQIVLNRLHTLRTMNNYKKLNKELKYLYNGTTVFLTPYDCKYTVNLFTKITTLRHFLNKCVCSIINKRNTKKEVINTQDLEFQEIKETDTNIIKIENLSKIYQFRINEILTIYKFSVYNIDTNYYIPEPIKPKNPYTNEELTCKQNYVIYQEILKYFCKKGRCLPEHYILLKNSYFCTEKFKKKYYCYLIYKAAITETHNLSDDDWLLNIDNYLCNYSHYCNICFRKLKNVRQIFSGILELFVLNENDVYSYGDAENEYVKIASKHNLIFNEKHEIQHRNIVRARRPASWRNNRASRTTNTVETNNNESTIINQLDNESNDSSSENASQSESLQSFSDMSDNLEELPFLPSEDNSSI